MSSRGVNDYNTKDNAFWKKGRGVEKFNKGKYAFKFVSNHSRYIPTLGLPPFLIYHKDF